MTDLNNLLNPLFLNEKEIKKLMELLFFSYREFISGPDKILEKIQFGRAHHRIIYFVGKKKEITIKELLQILRITKQSLSRVLNQLVKKDYIYVTVGSDKRTKKLFLTSKGIILEKELSTIQITKIRNILKKANENDINGFKKILYSMVDAEGQKIFNILNK
jgi:DNA-binding MarR family transcriptional regulator